jgi:hypothetical protein
MSYVRALSKLRLAVLFAVTGLATFALVSGVASALVKNNTFGSAGSGSGQFNFPKGIAVDQSTGDIYVGDQFQARVEKFNSAGVFQEAWGWGVADGNAQFETCTATCQSGIGGNGQGQFSTPSSLAVDSTTHDVYVGDSGNQELLKFTAAGAFVSSNDGTTSTQGHFQNLAAIAVDQSGNLWTEDSNTGNVDEFDNTGAFQREWNDGFQFGFSNGIAVDATNSAVYVISNSGNAVKFSLTGTNPKTIDSSGFVSSLAVDPGTGDLYAGEASNTVSVAVYDKTGAKTDSFPANGILSLGGLSLRSSTTQLAILDQSNNDVETFVPAVPSAPVVDAESTPKVGAFAATLSAQINPFGADTSCTFEYVDDTTFQTTHDFSAATSVPCSPASLGPSFTDQTATADISGLTPSTAYDYRVVAKNAQGTTNGSTQTFTTAAEPFVDSESATGVTDTAATIRAQINPNGGDTTAQFEFGTDTSYTGGKVPAKPVDVGNGTTDAGAAADLTGLKPDTIYHYRVILDGQINGPDEAFKTFAGNAAGGLPDGRGYEMVTPVDKDNGEPFLRQAPSSAFQASTDGNAISFLSFDAFQGSVWDGSFYVSRRGASNWTSENVIPPQSTETGLLCATLGAAMMGYSPDLSKGVLADGGSLIGSCGQPAPPLVNGEPQGKQNLFVRNNGDGTYQLVNVTPGSATPANANVQGFSSDLSHVVFDEAAPLTADAGPGDNLYDWSGGTVHLVSIVGGNPVTGAIAGGNAAVFEHGISTDGSTIFFTSGGNLYVRQGDATTKQVDAPAAGAPGPGGGGSFGWASADGKTVVFTDDASAGLTSDTVAGSGTNIYEYNTASAKLTDLTANEANTGAQGVSMLTGDPLGTGYLYYGKFDGTNMSIQVVHGGHTSQVAQISVNDSCNWSSFCLAARMSDNGRYYAFLSSASDPNTNPNSLQNIYLYDSQAGGKPDCVTCNPAATHGTSFPAPASPAIGSGEAYMPRNVSDTGQVFFNSQDQLVQGDNNSHEDVYEWEKGALSLLSSGHSPDDTWFIDSSSSGNDVFIGTSDQLVSQDTDTAMDLYDVRVGGGFPASAPPPVCQGEGCKPLPTGTPPVPPAATITFSGPGNVKPSHAKSKHGKKHKKKKAKKSVTVRRAVTGDVIALRVRVPGAGRLTATGAGVSSATRNVRQAGTVLIRLRVTPALRRALAHQGKRKLTIRVRYEPAGGSASTATVHLTVES